MLLSAAQPATEYYIYGDKSTRYRPPVSSADRRSRPRRRPSDRYRRKKQTNGIPPYQLIGISSTIQHVYRPLCGRNRV